MSGVRIGAVSGLVDQLVGRLINLAQRGAEAFAGMVSRSVELSSNLDNVRITFEGILGNNPQAAQAVMDKLHETSLELGASFEAVSKLAQRFLPRAESVDQVDRLVKAAVVLASIDPNQGVQGASISLAEALGGGAAGLRSLRERFEIDPNTIRQINALQKELGNTEGVLVGLEQFFEETGRSVENFGDTFQRQSGILKAVLEDIQTTAGEPLTEELTDQLTSINATLLQDAEGIDRAAQSFGELFALLANFAGTEIEQFLQGLDPDKIDEFFTKTGEAFNTLLTILDALNNTENSDEELDGLIEGARNANEVLEGILDNIDDIKAALDTLNTISDTVSPEGGAKFAQFVIDGLEEINAFLQSIVDNLGPFGDFINKVQNLRKSFVEGTTEGLSNVNDQINDLLGFGQSDEQAAEAQEQVNDALEEGAEREDDLLDAQEARTEVQAREVEGAEELADAILAAAKAEEEYGNIKKKAIDSQEDLIKAEEERVKKLIELGIKQAQAQQELLERQSDARELIDLRTQQAREDALLKYNQAVADLESGSEIAKAQRKANDERAQIDRDLAAERLRIEQDYQQELQRLQLAFQFSAREAAINVDAIAFAQAGRRLEEGRANALLTRDQQLSSAELDANIDKADISAQLAEEVREVEEANKAKLQSFQNRLDNELERIALNHAQANVLQDLQDTHAQDRLDRQQAKERENFQRLQDEKIAALQLALDEQFLRASEALEKEFALYEEIERRKTEVARREAAERARVNFINAQNRSGLPQVDSSFPTPSGGTPAFATGGAFQVGGSGGTDSQLVQFMASPNETVQILTPEQLQTQNRILRQAPTQQIPAALLAGSTSVDNSRSINIDGNVISGSSLKDEIENTISEMETFKRIAKMLNV